MPDSSSGHLSVNFAERQEITIFFQDYLFMFIEDLVKLQTLLINPRHKNESFRVTRRVQVKVILVGKFGSLIVALKA